MGALCSEVILRLNYLQNVSLMASKANPNSHNKQSLNQLHQPFRLGKASEGEGILFIFQSRVHAPKRVG